MEQAVPPFSRNESQRALVSSSPASHCSCPTTLFAPIRQEQCVEMEGAVCNFQQLLTTFLSSQDGWIWIDLAAEPMLKSAHLHFMLYMIFWPNPEGQGPLHMWVMGELSRSEEGGGDSAGAVPGQVSQEDTFPVPVGRSEHFQPSNSTSARTFCLKHTAYFFKTYFLFPLAACSDVNWWQAFYPRGWVCFVWLSGETQRRRALSEVPGLQERPRSATNKGIFPIQQPAALKIPVFPYNLS